MTEEKRKTLRWHPAFYAGIQIEFREEADCLEFIQEHTLGTEPVRTKQIRYTAPLWILSCGQIKRYLNLIGYGPMHVPPERLSDCRKDLLPGAGKASPLAAGKDRSKEQKLLSKPSEI